MPGAFFHHLFGDTSRALQEQAGSRSSYARREATTDEARDALTEREFEFLAARDSLYMASVTAEGWPYVQHRGGPPGFIKALGGNLIGFADYPGNRQFISFGNIAERGRVALFCMDYPARRRLKLIGQARVVTALEAPELVEQVSGDAPREAEAAVLIEVVGFDWNCPQYIEPRFTLPEIERAVTPLRAENAALKAELDQLRRLQS